MSTIKISDLNPTGSEPFSDSESCLNDLTNEELSLTGGNPRAATMFTARLLIAGTAAAATVGGVTLIGATIYSNPSPPTGAGNDPIRPKIDGWNGRIEDGLKAIP